ncbi:MAG TPA: AI-2E family transporter [Desulfobacteraceae bacterium]|nr:AI-2E family transporter [Desulfobacteraceae bacterium]
MQARFFFVIYILSMLLLGWVLWPFWQLLIFAFLLAGIFRPLYSWLCRWMSSWMASLLTCGLIVLIVFVPLTFCIGALSTETLNLYQYVRDANLLVRLQQFIQNNTLAQEAQQVLAGWGINFEPADLSRTLTRFAGAAGLFIYSQASVWAGNIMSFVVQFIILILVVYFLLIEIDRLLQFLMILSPLPADQNELLLKKFMEIAGAILVVNGISGLFQGLIGGAYFAVLGLKSPVLWGSVMAVLAFLPIFGIGLILIPTAIILLIGGHVGQGVLTFVFYIILSFTVEYILKPKFVGEQVKMHTVLVFLAIIGGMSLFGVLGIIYGPLIVTAFLTLSSLYLNVYRTVSNTD